MDPKVEAELEAEAPPKTEPEEAVVVAPNTEDVLEDGAPPNTDPADFAPNIELDVVVVDPKTEAAVVAAVFDSKTDVVDADEELNTEEAVVADPNTAAAVVALVTESEPDDVDVDEAVVLATPPNNELVVDVEPPNTDSIVLFSDDKTVVAVVAGLLPKAGNVDD